MSRFMIFLALSQPKSMTAGALELAFSSSPGRDLLRLNVPDGSRSDGEAGGPDAGGAFVVLADQDPVSVLFVDAPLPPDAWEDAVALDRLWPESRAHMERSVAHIVIAGLRPKTDHADVFDQALAVTLIAATLSTYLPVTAAIFTEARRIVPPDALRAAAQGLARREVPTELWSTIQFFGGGQEQPPKIGALTYGLAPFAGREIELQPVAMGIVDVAQRMLGLCQYLITHGPAVKDGETVGLTADEKFRAHYRQQGRRPGVPILELSYEG